MNKFIKAASVAIAVSLGATSVVTLTAAPAFAQSEVDAAIAAVAAIPTNLSAAQKQARLASILAGLTSPAAIRAAMDTAITQQGMTVAEVQGAAATASATNTEVAAVASTYVAPEGTAAGGPGAGGAPGGPAAGGGTVDLGDDAGAGDAGGGGGGGGDDPISSPS